MDWRAELNYLCRAYSTHQITHDEWDEMIRHIRRMRSK